MGDSLFLQGSSSHLPETGCSLPRGRTTRRRAPSARTPWGTPRSGSGERTCRERWRSPWFWSPPGPLRWYPSPSCCCCLLGNNPVAKAVPQSCFSFPPPQDYALNPRGKPRTRPRRGCRCVLPKMREKPALWESSASHVESSRLRGEVNARTKHAF